MINVSQLVAFTEDLHFRKVRQGVLLGKFEEIHADHASLQVLVLSTNATVPEHVHPDREEFQYVLSGNGEVELSGRKTTIKPGSLVFIPVNVKHSIKNTGSDDMRVMEVYAR